MNELFKDGTNPIPRWVSREAPLGSQASLFSVLSACFLCSPPFLSFLLFLSLSIPPSFFFLGPTNWQGSSSFPKCRGPGPPTSLPGDNTPGFACRPLSQGAWQLQSPAAVASTPNPVPSRTQPLKSWLRLEIPSSYRPQSPWSLGFLRDSLDFGGRFVGSHTDKYSPEIQSGPSSPHVWPGPQGST